MKRLRAPIIPILDVLGITSIEPILEVQSQREFLTHADWHEYPCKPITALSMARTEGNLYIRHSAQDSSPKASYKMDNSSVREDSYVEFFMEKEGDSHYMNFGFNYIGACDAAHRTSRDIETSLSQEEYKSIIGPPSVRRRAFKEIRGIHTWSLIVVIPLRLMGLGPSNLSRKILGNFYKCANETMNPRFVGWSPIDLPEPNFHCPEFFGKIYL